MRTHIRMTLLGLLAAWAPAAAAADPAAGATGISVPGARAERNPAAAQALFDEAKRLVQSGDFAAACPKFRASYELDPGGGTLLNLADCHARAGRTASAWSLFKEAEVMAQRDGRPERVDYARRNVRELEAQLVYLRVSVGPEARVPGLSLSVDGVPLAEAAWGSALPVDPGAHVLRAEAPGYEALEQNVEVEAAPGVRVELQVPPLVPSSSAAAASDDGVVPQPSDTGSSALRTTGWVLGGVGIAALGVGGFFGLRAMSRWDERNAACEGGCTLAARDAGDDAKSAATIATIGVSSGLVLGGIATVLLLTSGGDERPELAGPLPVSFVVSRREGLVTWEGSW